MNIDYDAIFKGEKKVMILSYKQIFYTVGVDAPDRPSDLFGDSVTFDKLALKGVNNDNPPAYVSNVAYGRTIYVKLETDSKSANVKAAFKALIDNQNISSNAEYQNILDQSSFTATVLGGGAQEHNKVITKDFNEIRNVIKNKSVYSPQNPAYPISYTSTFLKDNSITCINNKTAHFNTEIYLKGNARNISVKIKECTGLTWDWWRTIVYIKNIPLVKERIFSIGGTTLYPTKSVQPGI